MRAILITLALCACGPEPAATDGETSSTGEPGGSSSGSSTSSTGPEAVTGSSSTWGVSTSGAPTTGDECPAIDGLLADPEALASFCEGHPWDLAPECPSSGDTTCEEMLASIASSAACAALTACDYEACAAARLTAPCGARPPECAAIIGCIEPADCCEEHGTVDGAEGLCLAGERMRCIGCDWLPRLCMTHGCAVPDAEDCCLDEQGATVAC